MVHFTSNQATLQMYVPVSMRGRMASLQQLYPGFVSIGVLVDGMLADILGMPLLTVLLAVITAVFTALLLTPRAGLGALRVR
jgi:hypothetical protein